jgi:hypothetical protein
MSSFLPQYSTSSGDAHGYNERSGMSSNIYSSRYEGASYRGAPTWGNTNLKPVSRLATGGFPPQQTNTAPAIPNFAATKDVPISQPEPIPASRSIGELTSPTVRFDQTANSTSNFSSSRPAASFRSRAADVSTRDIDAIGPMGNISVSQGGPRSANKPRLSYDQEQSAMNVGKDSISRRLPEVERLRYHVPGYMGHVRRSQFHHGQTFGATTRSCILGYKPDSTPAL